MQSDIERTEAKILKSLSVSNPILVDPLTSPGIDLRFPEAFERTCPNCGSHYFAMREPSWLERLLASTPVSRRFECLSCKSDLDDHD